MSYLRIFFLSLAFLWGFVHAKEIGTVIKVRGQVTALAPGKLKASPLKQGQKVERDTSVLTQKGSFAIIKLKGGSSLTIGPDSKMVVDMTKSSASVISLLKGKMRSKVRPDKKKGKSKQFVKTQTAAMAVRGTEFISTYNPKNDITSLVTYKGKVKLKKEVDEELGKGRRRITDKDLAKLDNDLDTPDGVEVGFGEYASVTKKLKTATEPVRINPDQLAVLTLNETFTQKQEEIGREAIEKAREKIEREFEAKKDSGNAKRKDRFRPRAGGFIEIESGIYVPPEKEDQFDKNKNIFIEKDTDQKIDTNGNYKAPPGLALDPESGFRALKKETREKAKVLNQEIAVQLEKPEKPRGPRKPTFDQLDSEGDDPYEKYYE